MPQEIEIKLKTAHEPIREKLKSLRAHYAGTVRETNIFFDRQSELRKKDSGLRVRLARNHEKPNDLPQALLTFKGPAATTGLRSREAFDLNITPHDQLIPLLKALGYDQILLFEKDRESWELDGCKIELDTMPVFGTFIEIEGPDEKTVQAVQAELNLANVSPEHASYSKMVSQHLSKQGQTELRLSPRQ